MKNLIFLAAPFFAAAIAQVIKISIKQKGQHLGIRDFFVFTYSGMPSGHSALIVSLVTVIGLTQGVLSPLFAFALAFALIVINDALRLRRQLGRHGEILNDLVKELKGEELLERKYPRLLENIGHTNAQVLAGIALGFAIGVALYIALWL